MKVSKSAIFLFELMVVILVFSFAAAVCTSIFAKSYEFSERSKALTMAVIKAESAAEDFKGETDADSDREEAYTSVSEYDKDWNDAGGVGDSPVYRLEAQVSDPIDGMRICKISVFEKEDKGNPIYELEAKSYEGLNG
jgi:type II secretory pathway pseudopilin PulG